MKKRGRKLLPAVSYSLLRWYLLEGLITRGGDLVSQFTMMQAVSESCEHAAMLYHLNEDHQ
jgi:hypothetical protein